MISHAEAIIAAASPARAFAAAAGCDAPAIFKAQGALPGVAKTEGHEAPWSAPGETRRLTLTDGSSLLEELAAFAPDREFAYRASGYGGPFGALVAEGRGRWRFEEISPSETRIEWRYSFAPSSVFAAPLVWFIVKLLWPGYMRSALARLKAEAEAPAPAP